IGWDTHDYSNRLTVMGGNLETWTYAKVALVVDDQIVKEVTFDATGWTSLGWFAPRYVLSSSWTDLPMTDSWIDLMLGRDFAAANTNMGYRYFFINQASNCSDVQQWMTMLGNTGVGSTCTGTNHLDYQIYYSPSDTYSTTFDAAQADALMIF